MTGWTAIIPVKPWRLAKSRLDLSDDDRAQLARAFSLDVLDAALEAETVDRIVVVTAESELAATARRRGAIVLADRPTLAHGLLNQAIVVGRRWAKAHAPHAPVVVVPGDLASLTADVLTAALTLLATETRSFVPDASGTGTTLLAASCPQRLVPAYGEQSAARHLAAGYRPMPHADQRCRHDVDTAADLAVARRLGVGLHTTAAFQRTHHDDTCLVP